MTTQTILDRERYCGLPPEQRRELTAAERAAHASGLALFNYLQLALPDELKDRAVDVAAVGMISAVVRIVAEQRPAQAAGITMAFQAILSHEFAHWARIAGGEHVCH